MANNVIDIRVKHWTRQEAEALDRVRRRRVDAEIRARLTKRGLFARAFQWFQSFQWSQTSGTERSGGTIGTAGTVRRPHAERL